MMAISGIHPAIKIMMLAFVDIAAGFPETACLVFGPCLTDAFQHLSDDACRLKQLVLNKRRLERLCWDGMGLAGMGVAGMGASLMSLRWVLDTLSEPKR